MFLFSSPLRAGGNKIYQPLGGGSNCDYSIYSNGTTQFRVPFVEQDTQLPVIISFDGYYVDNGQVPKLNTLDDITVVWYPTTAILTTDTEPVTAHEFATIVNITRGGKTRPYSHKTSAGVVDLLYYRNDASQVVYFDGDYTIPLSVTSPVTFGYSLTNGNVSGAVIAEFEQALTAGQSNDVIIPEFTDDWGNEILLADRTTAVMYEDAVYIVSPINGYKTNLLLVPVEWVNNAGTTVNDDEVIDSHEFATDVDITRGTAPNTDTVTISHKDGVPVAELLYYRDDLGVRVDFNGTYTVPETVTSPVTLGWSITNGNVSGEVEQTEFDEVLTTGANSVVLPAFTDDWGNSVAIGDRTFSVNFGASEQADIIIDFVTGQTIGVRPSSIQSTGSDATYAMTFQSNGTIVDSAGFIGFSMEDARTGPAFINHTSGGLADPWLKSNQTIFLVYKRVYGVYSPIVYGDFGDSQGFARQQTQSSGQNNIRTNYGNTRPFGTVLDGNIVAECVKMEDLYLKGSDTLGNSLVDLVQSNPFVTDKRFNMGTDNKNVVAYLEIWSKALTDQECSDRLAVLASIYGTT